MTTSNFSRQRTKTRLALMNASIQLILEDGYDALTVKAITDRADYGHRVFYLHFQDKEDILYHIMTHWLEKMTDNIFAQVKHYASPEREYRAFKMIMQATVDNIHFLHQTDNSMGNAELSRRFKNFAIQDVKKHISLGNLMLHPNVNIDTASQLHVSSMMEFLRSLIHRPKPIDIEQQANDFFRYTFRQEPPRLDN